MSDRILVWVDLILIQFAISKFLQNMHDCELFAIYDFNHHIKKSFLNQKIVNFKKEWFYWDHVLDVNVKPDINYLKSFEEKYKIDLWLIAINDRVFYQYNQFYKFTKNEILSILEQECRFFEKVLNEANPDFLIIKVTDSHRSHLLEQMCRSKGIKILMLETSRLGYRSVVSEEANEIDYLESMQTTNTQITFSELRDNLKKFDRYEQAKSLSTGGFNFSKWEKFKASYNWMIKTFDKEYRMGYDHFGLTRFNAITDRFSAALKRSWRTRYIDRNLERKIANEKFVYFPLSVEPERTLSISAPFYTNQLEIINNIARSLPVDYKLYIKEHMAMKYRHWRPISFYKKIMNLPNVTLIHPSLSNKELLYNCSMVCTITGTAGLEAAYYGKPSIIFGHTSYDSLPSVHRIKNLEDLPTLIRNCLDEKVNPSDVFNLVKIIENISFDLNLIELYNKISNSFHSGGFLISNNIEMEFLDSFIEQNNVIFEMLAKEHIKKIEQHKRFKKQKFNHNNL
ncbi:Capsule polysaccharide biosynthesis protein [Marine Group I thaumarchaeote SCGC AAA799-P11]|uniref:Capsule polysaccharide biosynthesis protein n=1 Tax=Marine Group I thaumarchaeote SCGC AAA799-P11 TaxID=1502295 RepID=A0A087S312_9ARCH|nr:Capsule polysaccharide biosynthesis protein [Marine Group I thaumarchaeote SCGC AAA799-P11]